MKFMRYFSFAILCILLLLAQAKAATFYRHVPFKTYIEANDLIVVDYDFSEKKGIYCSSHRSKFSTNFVYKGHRKTAFLPIHLESDHVPDKPGEELADINGQFTIAMENKKISSKQYEISCTYGDE